MSTKKTATLVKDVSSKFVGSALLWKCDPPMAYDTYTIDGAISAETVHVVTSAVREAFAHETYIFPADAGGKVTDWGELHGSYRGGTDHDEALRIAGYEAVR